MPKGTVKWFNPTKGYGFIQPQAGGGKDVFVHISAVERAGLSSLNEGQVVEYEEVSNRGKTSAENLKVQRWFPFGSRQPITAALPARLAMPALSSKIELGIALLWTSPAGFRRLSSPSNCMWLFRHSPTEKITNVFAALSVWGSYARLPI
jgi:CspA family cold shock protein